ncbi:hypothetical protein [Epilithonimonas mollis]|uniref:hypothetical protein n=1 Tax=Epilithonimonas mollis TaxID=216903 RepID=UPI001114862B|nr:hypothetical protein [Epilithonimonas mollis]
MQSIRLALLNARLQECRNARMTALLTDGKQERLPSCRIAGRQSGVQSRLLAILQGSRSEIRNA